MLFEPFPIRTMTLPNRLVLPAMVTRLSGEDGIVNDDIRARYVRFAKGGVGLVVIEAMAVHGAKSGPLLRISSDDFVPGLSDLAKRVHDAGPSKVVPQIIHFLKINFSDRCRDIQSGKGFWTPSAQAAPLAHCGR